MLDMKKTFTTGEVATIVGVSSRTVAEMVDRQQLKGFKLPGGDRRIPRENLIRYLKSIDHSAGLREIGE